MRIYTNKIEHRITGNYLELGGSLPKTCQNYARNLKLDAKKHGHM